MADESSRKYNVGPPATSLGERTEAQKRYFFLDQKLYKMLRQYRAGDLLVAWDYEDDKIVHFILSDAKRNMKNAYDTVEVARLLNRKRATIQSYVLKGAVNPPIKINQRGENAFGKPFGTMKWSEDDVIALHEFLLTKGGGRPRKDGTLYGGARLPTRRELIAMLRNQPTFYMRTASGEFVPVWSANNEV